MNPLLKPILKIDSKKRLQFGLICSSDKKVEFFCEDIS